MKPWTKLRALFARRRLEREMAEEMQAHLDGLAERNVAAGMSPEEARYAALRAFGGVEQIKERAREVRGWGWLRDSLQDARHGLRLMRKHWAYSAFVIVIMALGVGAVTSVCSVINAVALRPLPVREPERLATVSGYIHPMSFFERLRDDLQSASEVMAVGYPVTRGWRIAGQPPREPASTEEVSGNFFTGLGLKAAKGRLFTPADDQPGPAAMVAVITYEFWQRSFGGSEEALGTTIFFGENAVTIIGVTPAEFSGVRQGYPIDIWLPLQLSARLDGDQPWGIKSSRGWLGLLVRMRPECSLAQAQAELDVIQSHDAPSDTGASRRSKTRVEAAHLEDGSHGFNTVWRLLHTQLLVLLGMAGGALLIACANLSSLILVRSTARADEVATRMALGASRGRVMRQLATESLLLTAIGGALGAMIAGAGARALMGYAGSHLDVAPDLGVLGWTLAITLLAGSGCSVFPAWLSTDRGLLPGLKSRVGGSMQRRQNLLGRVLVVAQIALSFMLVTAAILLGQTLRRLQATNLGYERAGLLTFVLRNEPGASTTQEIERYRRILARLQALPGVRGATFTGSGMFSQILATFDFSTADAVDGPKDRRMAKTMMVGPDFFETLGVPIRSGRGFDASEASLLPRVDGTSRFRTAVISESFARRWFSGVDPVGRHFTLRGSDVEIVGVAGDMVFSDLKETSGVDAYLSHGQNPGAWRYPMLFAVRGIGPVKALAADIRQVVGEIAPSSTVDGLMTVDVHMEQLTRNERINARVAGFIGGFAALLAGVGLFGVLVYSTRQRTREIGIRMALGASVRDVLWQVIRQAVALMLLGGIAGLAGYLCLARLLASMVYGVGLTSPYALAATALGMVIVAGIACWLPARRAANVDPMEALRCE